MFSDIKWHIRCIMDGFYKERKLTVLVFFWTALCVYGNGIGLYDTYAQLYQVKISTVDVLIIFQDQWRFGVMLLPIFVFLVMKCSKDCLNLQQLMRYRSRKKMFQKQIWESFGYAVVIIVVILTVETFFFRIMTGSFINWDQIDSLYYSKTGKADEDYILLRQKY